MKKAKKYLGRKLLLTIGQKDSEVYFEEKINTLRSLEDFKNDVENSYYSSIKIIEDNIELYRCSKFKTNNLATLVELRKRIATKCEYNEFLTKEEIIELLKLDYVVCVEGLQEIDLDNINQL